MNEKVHEGRQVFYILEILNSYQNILANISELLLDFLAVFARHRLLSLAALGLLLNARDDSPRGSSSANHILVGDREQIALFVGQLTARLGYLFHGGGHVFVAFSLLGQLSSLHLFFFVGHFVCFLVLLITC